MKKLLLYFICATVCAFAQQVSGGGTGGGAGSVTSVSGADAHISVATGTTTPVITFVPQSNDYAFNMISGLLADGQLPADAARWTSSTQYAVPFWTTTGGILGASNLAQNNSTGAQGISKGFYLTRATVAFNAGAPVFDFSLGNFLSLTLTGTATATTLNTAAINTTATPFFGIEICQDATGSRSFTWPTGFGQAFSIDPRPNQCQTQMFIWDGSAARPLGPATYSAGQATLFISGVQQAAPSSNPASGAVFCWFDSTGLNLECLNASGNKSGMAFAKTAIAAQALTAFDPTTGLFTQAGLQVAANPQTGTYQVLGTDFPATGCGNIPVASGTFTITLVASGSQPANGRCLNIINYGSGVITIARSGQNINGAAANLTLNAGSSTAPTGAYIISDASNYEAQLIGGSTISGLTTNFIPKAGSATTIVNSLLDDGSTTANTLTYTGTGGAAVPNGPISTGAGASCSGGSASGYCASEGTAITGAANVDQAQGNSTQHALSINNNNTGVMVISRVAAVNVTPATVNTSTTSDQNLMAVSLSANLLNVTGRTFKVFLGGVYSNVVTAQPTVTLKIKLCTVSGCGSGTVITPISIASTVTSATAVTNLAANLTGYVSTQTAGASSAYEAHGNMAIDLGTTNLVADSIFADVNTATVGTIDSTGALFLQAAVAFSGASTSNSFTARQLIVEVLN